MAWEQSYEQCNRVVSSREVTRMACYMFGIFTCIFTCIFTLETSPPRQTSSLRHVINGPSPFLFLIFRCLFIVGVLNVHEIGKGLGMRLYFSVHHVYTPR